MPRYEITTRQYDINRNPIEGTERTKIIRSDYEPKIGQVTASTVLERIVKIVELDRD